MRALVIIATVVLCGVERAVADTVEERERRIDEIAGWLAEKPKADGARFGDRAAWERLALMPEASGVIAEAGEIVGLPIPEMPDALYLEFTRNGVRINYENLYFERERRFGRLMLAECMEGKGRFLPKLCEYIDAFCAMRSWTLPAHDPRLTSFEGKPHIDLFSADLALVLAQACDIMRDVLPQKQRDMIAAECDRRVFLPYLFLARNFRDGAKRATMDYNWWYDCRLNWNSVCHSCAVRAALALVADRRTRAEFIASAESAVPFALSAYLSDGYCTEGMGYWDYGYGHHVMMGLAVRAATGGKVDFFSDSKNRLASQYAYGFQLEPFKSPPFADGVASPSLGVLSLIRQVYPELTCAEVEGFSLFGADGNRALVRSPQSFMVLRAFGQEPPRTVGCGSMADMLGARTWFPAAQVLVARARRKGCKESLSLAIKGGHNAELHNHNDLGSYTIMLDGVEMCGDPGKEVYTRRTFSDRRYDSKILNSYGHPVPVVGGRLQQEGGDFKAEVLRTDFTEGLDTIAYDLTKAYDAPDLKSLVRTVVFDREKMTVDIEDAVEFSKPSAFEVPIVTYRDCEGDVASGRFVLCHPDGGRSLAVSVSGSAPIAFRSEKIENAGLSAVTRLGFGFSEPVAQATLKMSYTPASAQHPPLAGADDQ